MPTDVWPVHPTGQKIARLSSVTVFSFGDGWEQRADKDQNFAHGDLMGGVTSHKGRSRFEIQYDIAKQANGDITQEFNQIVAFLNAHRVAAFYFYNRGERATPDLTGSDPTGRYLVRVEWSAVSYALVFNKLHSIQAQLVEVRA
jgi:hypothetical protein